MKPLRAKLAYRSPWLRSRGWGDRFEVVRKRRFGYTLVEALVAISIFSLAIVATSEILKISVDTTGKARANNEIISRLNLLQARITQDLEAMPPDAFMAFNFHYEGPFRVIANAADKRRIYTRADRMVYYTAATTSAGNGRVFYTDINGHRRPVTGRLARVFIGQGNPAVDRRFRTPEPGSIYTTDKLDPLTERQWWWGRTNHAPGKGRPVVDRILARRVTVLAPGHRVQAIDPTLKLFTPPADWIADGAIADPGFDLSAEADQFDYTFKPLAYWENQPAAAYENLFLTEDAAASWMRRPTVTPPNFDNAATGASDPIGLHMLMMAGVAEFKVQVWVERNDPEFLSVQDIEKAITGTFPKLRLPLIDDPDLPNPAAHTTSVLNLPRDEVENVVYGSSQFPRWYPEEDFRKDDDSLAEKNDRPSWVDDNDFWGGFNDPLPGFTLFTIGRAFSRFGFYFGGPADLSGATPLSTLIVDQTTGLLGAGVQNNYPLTKRPRAIKITVRFYDPNDRFSKGREQSFVVELPRAD